jgi:hypothetical protein
MSQPLTISFQSDTSGARNAIASLAATITSNMVNIGTSMRAANDNMTSFGSGLSRLPVLLGAVGLAFVGFKAGEAAIAAAVEQMDRLVELSKAAKNIDVSATWLDAMVKKTQDLKQDTDELTQALKNAYEVSKPTLDRTGAGQPSQARATLSSFFESGYYGDFQSQGLAIFDRAKNTEERVRGMAIAIQEAMRNLDDRLGGIDLAERLFGKEFGEKVRQNEKYLDDFVNKLDEVKAHGGGVSEEDVKRAEELTKRIADAKDELGKMFQATIDLSGAGRTLLGIWATILEKAVGAANAMARASTSPIPGTSQLAQMTPAELAAYRESTGADLASRPDSPYLFPGQRGGQSRALDEATERLREAQRASGSGRTPYEPESIGHLPYDPRYAETGGVPVPQRTPFGIRQEQNRYVEPKPTTSSEDTDEVERYLRTLEKTVEVLKAENETFGKGNVAKAEAVDLERALAAARQRGTPLTDKEREAVKRLADEEGHAKDRARELQRAQEAMNEQAQFLGNQMISAFDKIGTSGAKATEVIKDMVRALIKAVEQALILGTGPFAHLFGTQGAEGQQGGLAGFAIRGISGAFGGGGSYGASDYAAAAAAATPGSYGPGFSQGGMVGRDGERVFIPRSAIAAARQFDSGGAIGALVHPGEVILNAAQQKNVAAGIGPKGNISITHAPVINGTGLSKEEVFSLLQRNNKEFARHIGPIFSDWRRRFE